jgi:hypothetical protein
MAKHGTEERFTGGCRCKPCISAHMSFIGSRGAQSKMKKFGKKYFSKIAKLSHPVNNPNAHRTEYTGGRPLGSKNVKVEK